MLRRKPLASLAISLIALAAFAWSGPLAEGQTASCSVSSTDQAIDAEEQALLNLINQYRAQFGKNALTFHPTVTKAAAWLSRDMATKNYFSHVDSNGRNVGARLTWCGVTYSNYAENIYAGRSDAQSVFNAWRNSSGHNSNMLRDGVTAAGIGRAYQSGSTYGWYWTLDVTNSSVTASTTSTTRAAASTTTTTPWWATTTTTRATTTTTRATTTTTRATTTTTRATTTTTPATTTTTRNWCPPQYAQYCTR